MLIGAYEAFLLLLMLKTVVLPHFCGNHGKKKFSILTLIKSLMNRILFII